MGRREIAGYRTGSAPVKTGGDDQFGRTFIWIVTRMDVGSILPAGRKRAQGGRGHKKHFFHTLSFCRGTKFPENRKVTTGIPL